MASAFKGLSNARFFAVQALYQLEQTDKTSAATIQEFQTYRFPISKTPIDNDLFERLVKGMEKHLPEIDLLIESILSRPWQLERLDAVIRAILRAGFFELKFAQETPYAIIINDYLNITKEFVQGTEVAFVNVALDKGAKSLNRA